MLRPPCHPPLTKILAAKAFQDFSGTTKVSIVDNPVTMLFEIGAEVVRLFPLHILEERHRLIHLTFP
jgi:hypothetical protein